MHLRESRPLELLGALSGPQTPRPLLALRYALATQDAQKFSASPKKAPTFKFLAKSLLQSFEYFCITFSQVFPLFLVGCKRVAHCITNWEKLWYIAIKFLFHFFQNIHRCASSWGISHKARYWLYYISSICNLKK